MFIVLIWFTMKVVWPMILGPMDERSRKFAAGLAAAEKGTQELASANERANDMVEEAKGAATAEGARLLASAKEQIDLEAAHAREALRRDVAQIAVSAASKILEREIDPRAHSDLIDKLAAQI